MSSVVYSLKNGINRTNNPTIGGVFAYGSYTSAGAFTLFTEYEYSDGTAFTSEPFDTAKVLVWKGGSEYPHIGFENLNPNSNITPQPFPSFGIYLHPFVVDGVRQDVGVRVTIPFSGNLSIASTIQRGDTECGDDIGYRIMKNGVAIQSRQFIQPSNTPTNINTPPNFFNAGDIIDFIVDIGSQNNSFCDDTALEVSLIYQYDKIPTPVIETSPVICSTTTISGTTAFVAEGTLAELYLDSTLLGSVSVTMDLISYTGSFSFSGLDLTTYEGKTLKVVLKRSGDIDSDYATVVVGSGGCEDLILDAPVVTEADWCKKKYLYKRTISGNATESGNVALFKYPYTEGDDIIAAANVNMSLEFFLQSENIETDTKYVAMLINYDGVVGELTLNEVVNCNPETTIGAGIKGYAKGITNGILNIYTEDNLTTPVLTDIIREEVFDIFSTKLYTGISYVLVATKLN